jgi:hypothetical protein
MHEALCSQMFAPLRESLSMNELQNKNINYMYYHKSQSNGQISRL